MSVRSSSHLFGFGGSPLGTRDLDPLNLFSVRCDSHHRRRPVPQRATNAANGHKLAPGDSSAYQGFRRRYLRLLGDDGKFAPVPRWTRNEVRRDHRGVLQDQSYAKTLGVRKAAHCLTGAVLSFVLAALDSATTRCTLPPLGRALLGANRVFAEAKRGPARPLGGSTGCMSPLGWV